KFLGLQYRPEYSIFRVWAPTQDKIMLALYEDDSSIHRELYQMTKTTDGVFELSLEGNLEGKFYTYIVGENEVTDPYAVAVSENGIRVAIIDIFKSNPPGWRDHKVKYEEKTCDPIIYEVHLADYNGFDAK